jgi:transcriptional regulator with XRE-family HTH domain
MPKRARKSQEFGTWVKQARLQSGKSQKEIAESLSVTQQYLSKIELQGVVPSDAELVRLCEILGKPEEEARKILGITTKADERLQVLEREFLGFQQWLISRPRPIHIYIVREDPEPVDENSAMLHYEILSAAPDLKISILFRYFDRKNWASFRRLVEVIKETFPKAEKKIPNFQSRISGYLRKPEFEEDSQKRIPLGQPAVVVMDKDGPNLFYYGSPPPLYHEKQVAEENYLSQYNTALSEAPKVKAELFVNWIEIQGLAGKPSDELWAKIFLNQSFEEFSKFE